MKLTYKQFRQVMNLSLNIPPKSIKKSSSLYNDLHIADWELDLLANHVERAFLISVNDQEWHSNQTVNDLVKTIESRMAKA